MELSLGQIALFLQGELKGDSALKITGVSGLKEAKPSDISFLKDLKDIVNRKNLENTKAGCVIVPMGVEQSNLNLIVVKNPLKAFAQVLEVIQKEKDGSPVGVHPTSYVSPTAQIGKDVFIGPLCVIEDGAVIGDGCRLLAQNFIGKKSVLGAGTKLYPQSVVREEVTIGKNCLLHSGCVIGSDGYGFFFDSGKHNKISQVGNVILEDDVEVGSCTTIDRATTGSTIVRKGTKIDNLVQIAHNVDIGQHCLIVAQVGIAGSTKLGTGVVLAGQVGVADHANIGDGVQVGGQSAVMGDIKAGSVLFGSPAQPIQENLRQMFLIRKLPDLFKEIKQIKAMLKKND
ncbi:MAG: UDP-3-O-(3-hydroxymyristoyl)glucosamine N-acyltransferase [Elusimicrobiota bacterium]